MTSNVWVFMLALMFASSLSLATNEEEEIRIVEDVERSPDDSDSDSDIETCGNDTTRLCSKLITKFAKHFPKEREVIFCGECDACKKFGPIDDYYVVLLLLIANGQPPVFTKSDHMKLQCKISPCLRIITHPLPIGVYAFLSLLSFCGATPLIVLTFIPNIDSVWMGLANLFSIYSAAFINVIGEYEYNAWEKGKYVLRLEVARATEETKKRLHGIANALLTEYMVNLGFIKQRKHRITEIKSIKNGQDFADFIIKKTSKELDDYLSKVDGGMSRVSFSNIELIVSKVGIIDKKLQSRIKNTAELLAPLNEVVLITSDHKYKEEFFSYIFNEEKNAGLLQNVYGIITTKSIEEIISANYFWYKK